MSRPSPDQPAAVAAARLARQLLTHPAAPDPAAITRHLLAVQGQDPRGARLALRARSRGLLAADIDRALTEDRSLVITWLNRGTLHLIHRDDYPLLHALTTPQLAAANARRLAQERVDARTAERGVKVVVKALEREGPLTRYELRDRLDHAAIPTAGQALVHILMRAAIAGFTVRGPMRGIHHAYVLVDDWLGRTAPPPRDQALTMLARRFLAGHGPADERDLAKWAGITLADARRGLTTIGRDLVALDGGLVDLKSAPRMEAELPSPRLLGPFDPVQMGWRSREPVLGSHVDLVTINGLFRPFAMVRGRAVGIWSAARNRIEMDLRERVSKRDQSALLSDAHDIARFFAWPGQSEH